MITIEHISHFAAAVVTRATDTCVYCIGLLSTARPCGAATSTYSPSSHRIRTTDVYQWCIYPGILNPYFVRPPFCIHAHARNYTFHCHVVSACDEAYCNLDDRFLVLFAISFLDTRISVRKCGNIPTSNLRADRYWPRDLSWLHSNPHRRNGVRRPLVPL